MSQVGGEKVVPNGLEAIQYSIDFVTAILLLTGRITTTGIFVVPEGFYLSATGPILGGTVSRGKTQALSYAFGMINVLSALLLILNVIRVTGPYITSRRAFIVFSGELFGIKEIAGVVRMKDMNPRTAAQLGRYIRTQALSITDQNNAHERR
ncbi:hypothetical protein [Alicyclobacillus sp. ALC3]|uniref:hypothetical protein n=1 Tax=Alicyclobacillus sp. ALC3 TaxID=2796143 RepID=UPI0023781A0B|nr:hypothetical protein [Alicyclobacillus sp. ALC3]WDL96055.1 hypothetical protein JC200_17165 [Alicyclobacillus sp. ALC3]